MFLDSVKGKCHVPFLKLNLALKAYIRMLWISLLPEAYMQAVKETEIDPIDRPEVDVQQMVKGQPLKFTAKVEVKPEVQLR